MCYFHTISVENRDNKNRSDSNFYSVEITHWGCGNNITLYFILTSKTISGNPLKFGKKKRKKYLTK